MAQPRRHLEALLVWLGLAPLEFDQTVRSDLNARYFAQWREVRGSILRKHLDGSAAILRRIAQYERRSNAFGYSLERPEALLPLA